MSDQKDKTESTEPEQSPVPQAESESEREQSRGNPEKATRSQSAPRSMLAALALLLALASIALWFWQWQEQQAAPETDQLESTQAEQAEQLERLEVELGRVDERLDEMADRSERRESEADQLEQRLSSLNDRIDDIEQSLDELGDELRDQMQSLWQRDGEQRQADRELERRMLMLEAASLLRLGQERAELAGDHSAARAAYRRAAELLQRADDPRLGQVRREVARELEALENLESPDWLRIQTRIERLAGHAPRWPAASASPLQPASSELGEEEADDQGWRSALRDTFSQLVRVRPRDTLSLDEEDIALLAQQVVLRLGAAELAAARRDGDELGHHLRAASRLLEAHFDTTDATVSEALETLEELGQVPSTDLPAGLGRAQAALREHLDDS